MQTNQDRIKINDKSMCGKCNYRDTQNDQDMNIHPIIKKKNSKQW